ncbi:MAG: sigma-E processing peptidase SpoIIGA [Clostridia bacterium]|nr:sigma-E processing peptidase SpoIIGA [Clostridia bacterium]
MSVSIEAYVLINFAMNAAIVGIVARSRGGVVWWRVAFASAFASLYALAMESGLFPQLNWLVFKLALAISMTIVAIRVESIWQILSGTLLLLGATVFTGGIVSLSIRLFGRSALTLFLGAIGGIAALVAATQTRQQKLDKWEAQVFIKYRDTQARLSAMIDTGNRLREPFSNLPVLIVEWRAIRNMLPAGFDAHNPCGNLPAGYRLASFGTLGAKGEIALFRPDELLVSYGDGWLAVSDIWIGVYPGNIPGQYHAIAPAVMGRISADKYKYFEGSGHKWSTTRNKQ